MALVNIANEDRVITITPRPLPWPLGSPTPPAPGVWVPGTPTYTEHPSAKVKTGAGALKKPVLITRISWIMAGCTLAAHTFVSGATSTPIPDSPALIEKVREIYDPFWSGCPIGKGDKGYCSGSFTLTAAPFTVGYCMCTFEVTNAGQVKASGE